VSIQLKTARLTVLLDPTRKLDFEQACRGNDMTPSQVLRHLIRDYVEAHATTARPARSMRMPPAAPRAAATPPKRANSRHG
jgi:hypothetical protein